MSKASDAAMREERRLQVSELLKAGATQREMAEELGFSLGTINSDVRAIRKEWRKYTLANVEDAIAQDLMRLETAVSSIWNSVLTGNLDAIQTLLGIIAARAKIYGYAGIPRDQFDEARGKQATPGMTVNMYGDSQVKLPPFDVKLIQSIAELPTDGLDLFIKNMLLAGDGEQQSVIEGVFSHSNEDGV